MPERPKQLDRKTVYTSPWINLHLDKVEFPDGRVIDEFHVLDYPMEGVGVVITNDKGEILLEYAYRYHSGKDGWEIPAGGIDTGESIIEAGKREALEETGYKVKSCKLTYSFNPSNGSSNQVLNVISCKVTDDQQEAFDENEVREVKWFTPDEVRQLIKDKKIADGFALIGLLIHLYDLE